MFSTWLHYDFKLVVLSCYCLIILLSDIRELMKHYMLRSSAGLQGKREICVLCYQHCNMCVLVIYILHICLSFQVE